MPLKELTYFDWDDLTPEEQATATKAGMWSASDLQPLRNRERYERAFENVPYPISFHCTNDRPNYISGDKRLEANPITGLPFDEDTISVFVCCNVNSTDALPMTPWILGHRAGHALQASSSAKLPSGELLSNEGPIMGQLIRLVHEMFPVASFDNNQYHKELIERAIRDGCNCLSLGSSLVCYIHPRADITEVLSWFIDSKACRNGRVVTGLDLFGDLFAEYLIRGSVRLRIPNSAMPMWGASHPRSYKGPAPFAYVNPEAPRQWVYDEVTERINALMDEQLRKLRGTYIAF